MAFAYLVMKALKQDKKSAEPPVCQYASNESTLDPSPNGRSIPLNTEQVLWVFLVSLKQAYRLPAGVRLYYPNKFLARGLERYNLGRAFVYP
jgi:hypothetical protein